MKFWKYQRRVSPTVVLFPLRWPPPRYKTFYAFRLPRVRQPRWFTSSSYLILHFDAGSKYSSSRLYRYSLFLFFETFLLGNFIDGDRTRLKGTLAGIRIELIASSKSAKWSFYVEPRSFLSKNATGLTIRSLTSFTLENIIRDVFRDERR